MTDTIRDLISEQLFPLDETVTNDTDLHDEGLDSLALMQLILLLESEFAISISPEDLNRGNFSSLSRIAALVTNKQTP